MEIKLEGEQEIDGYLIFTLVSIGANIKKKEGTNEKTVWGTIQTPEAHPIKVAVQRYAGAGTQPENTITYLEIEDIATKLIKTLEDSIDNTNPKQGASW